MEKIERKYFFGTPCIYPKYMWFYGRSSIQQNAFFGPLMLPPPPPPHLPTTILVDIATLNLPRLSETRATSAGQGRTEWVGGRDGGTVMYCTVHSNVQ